MASSAEIRRLACERCFDRKHKCDRLLPSCSTCASLGLDCRERSWQFRGGDYTVSIKHASILSYVESLRREIHELENDDPQRPRKRQRISSHEDQDPSPSSRRDAAENGGNELTPGGQSVSSRELPAPNHHRSLSTRNTMGEIGFLSRSAMAEPRIEYTEPSRNLTLYKMIVAALALDSPDHSVADGHGLRSRISTHMPTDQDDSCQLDRKGTVAYMTLFANHVCIQYPYLSAKDAMVQYDTVITALVSDDRGHRTIHKRGLSLEYFNTCLGIAIGALLSPDAHQLSGFIKTLHDAATRVLPAILEKQNGLVAIRCMMTLAIFSLYSPSGGSAWHLVGLIMQRCVAMGLEVKADSHDEQVTETLVAEKISVFWSAYMLDRSISLAMGRPFSIQDEDITVPVPTMTEKRNNETAVEASLKQHVITQARLASRIHSMPSPSSKVSHYHNICFWREAPTPLRQLPANLRHIADHLDQLSCRMFMQLVDTPQPTPSQPFEHDPHDTYLTETMERDILAGCRRFVDNCYNRLADDPGMSYHKSFLDVTDVFCSSIVYVFLLQLRQRTTAWVADASEMVQKCLLLMTAGGGSTFTVTKVFHKTLLTLSRKLMGAGIASQETRNVEATHTSLQRLVPSHVYQLAIQML